MTTHLDLSMTTCKTDPVLDQLIEELANKLQAGEPVDVSTYARRYPDHADTLRRVLSALEVLGELGRSLATPSGRACSQDERPGAASGVLGDYQIIREVGRGGMGVVYEAMQISLGRRVALKVLPFAAAMDPRHLQRFQVEAQAAAHLHHGNIVPVFSVGSDRGVHFYAMQFIEGRSLPVGPPPPLASLGREMSWRPSPLKIRGPRTLGEGQADALNRRRPPLRSGTRPISPRSPGLACRPPKRWSMPTAWACSTGTSSRRTCWSMRRAISGSRTSALHGSRGATS
jgi:hypothetical protein